MAIDWLKLMQLLHSQVNKDELLQEGIVPSLSTLSFYFLIWKLNQPKRK